MPLLSSLEEQTCDVAPARSDLLSVRNLCVDFIGPGHEPASVLNSISMDVHTGETVGIVGESGCGKTTFALALIQLLPATARITDGSVRLGGSEMVGIAGRSLAALRATQISLVHQEPEGALHPQMRIGDQVAEIFRAHRPWGTKRCREEASSILEEVFKIDADRIFRSYPHELSGGQRQRALIAQAIACRPSLLVADEPTASLDVTSQAEIVSLIRELRQRHGMSLIFITHNLSSLTGLVDRVLVMYGGRIVEDGRLEDVFSRPRHPYTQALLGLMEEEADHSPARNRRLQTIPGSAPEFQKLPPGCVFEPRCASRKSACCSLKPKKTAVSPTHQVECILYEN
jgi:oligopeptide/dipeptide ABC transporter ATP-binding protein